jgi:pilus assembly protein CpaD
MPNIKNRAGGRLARTSLHAASIAVLAAFAAGCSTTGTTTADLALHDYTERHPIMISEEPEVLDIPVGMNGPALSAEIETAIRNYVAGYRQDGTGPISIQVPTAAANEMAAGATGHAVHYALVRAGVPHGHIQVVPYYFGNHAKTATLRLSYLRVKAVAPSCGIWPETTSGSNENGQYYNFGCATQQNLAAMVANPADLIAPQPMQPANGARRAKVLSDYAQGADPKSATTLIDSSVGD